MNAASPVPVLLVDDNAGKRMALKAILLPLGYVVVEADSGRAALRCVMERDFAVILLDVYMPIMDGFATATLIRQRRQSEMTPIIFITAYARDEIAPADRYVEGAVDFIFAPVQPEELRAKVSVFANLYRRAEELADQAREVQTSQDQLRMLTDSAPIGIFQTDSQNKYLYTNPRWTELTGVSAHDAHGQDWTAILDAKQRAEFQSESAEVQNSPTEVSRRFELTDPGRATRVILVTSTPIPDARGEVAGWVGTLADVTAEAGAEAAMLDARDKATDASRLKSDFLANMSHEIRTPMNGVIGMTDMLLESDLEPHQREYAQIVRNSGEALLHIINDILDFSKIEAGKLVIEDLEFTARTVVADVIDLLAGSAQTKGLELVSVVDSAVPEVVRGDPGRLRQILTNVIGNAVKFTQNGEVVLRVSVAEVNAAATVLRFGVSDTGDGIAPDKLDAIFQPFVQADNSTSRKYGGTGLGLSISSELVALMGGTCGATSRVGAGSEFWFTTRVSTDSGRAAREVPAGDESLAGVTALIVAGNQAQRDALSEFLTGWGMSVTTADSGRAALDTLRTAAGEDQPIAVVLVDQHLPEMDGTQLATAIHEQSALTVRVVLLTGLGQAGSPDLGTGSAVCAAVAKPIHREVLHSCLRAVLTGLTDVVPEARHKVSTRRPEPAHGSAVVRLLLAEDNEINQMVAIAMLSSRGYQVDTVPNGAQAVQAAAAYDYDAILMDCQMPELDGYEATAAIRAREGSGRRTPIIALTAGALREDRERCLASGMDSYLTKPVDKDALLALVAQSVGA